MYEDVIAELRYLLKVAHGGDKQEVLDQIGRMLTMLKCDDYD